MPSATANNSRRAAVHRLTIREGTTPFLMSRFSIRDGAGARAAVRADCEAIAYSVHDLRDGGAVVVGGTGVLVVADTVFDTLQLEVSSDRVRTWSEDDVGFNFGWDASASLFALAATAKRGEFRVNVWGQQVTAGNPTFPVGAWVVEVEPAMVDVAGLFA